MINNIEKLINRDISLNKENHEYKLNSNPNLDFYSCTQLIGDQFKPFEAEKIARFLVNRTHKYSNYTVDALLEEWKEARDLGARVHDELDNYIKYGSNIYEDKAFYGTEWLDSVAHDFGDKFYSEVIVYSEELKLAGTVDLLIYNSTTNECFLFDWKTSKKMDMSSRKNGITYASYDLYDCRFDKYSFQLNLYSHLLEKYHGVKIAGRYLLHLTNYGVDTLEASDLKSNVSRMINKLRSNYNLSQNFYQYA